MNIDETKAGYKKTIAGTIPAEWNIKQLGEVAQLKNGFSFLSSTYTPLGKYKVITIANVQDGYMDVEACNKIPSLPQELQQHHRLHLGDILISMTGNVGRVCRVKENDCLLNQRVGKLIPVGIDEDFLFFLLRQRSFLTAMTGKAKGGAQGNLSNTDITEHILAIPTDHHEQQAIATSILDIENLLTSLEQLIAKKRNIQQAAMQQLLTSQRRLPGFSGSWEVRSIEEIADCLDNLRVPLNESQRNSMKGDYPYCGANGVLDYINSYVIDDDIILMAEDGGYFDEYKFRPIAYRMTGKCWVNNHAHILKSKSGYDQGFLFYSLVHKNILSYLASGTRAKLNKSEMNKIEIHLPKEKTEQTAIATILADMDAELATLETRYEKACQLKQGMMQELLTGRIRLVSSTSVPTNLSGTQ
ncbi:restriction endonuclease subunit S [Ectopseudomonas oleovorans]|uniref:restriction endonuclease subunit S n=1 Tax=Ectopseudomonas oleovorans TaxID=301 RepID=UPI0035B09FFC